MSSVCHYIFASATLNKQRYEYNTKDGELDIFWWRMFVCDWVIRDIVRIRCSVR